jgi:hypothetical protein
VVALFIKPLTRHRHDAARGTVMRRAPGSAVAKIEAIMPACEIERALATLHWRSRNFRLNLSLALQFHPAQGSAGMATQIVMDHTGDSRHNFNPADEKALREAQLRFDALMKSGYTAAVRDVSGQPTVVRSFDPNAEETLFYPRLVGG